MAEEIYRPLIEDMTWSYSRIEMFEECPYRWFLSYIHSPKIVKEEKFYALYGLFMHDLLEKYYKGKNSKEELLMMFLTEFKDKTDGTGRPKVSTVQKYFKSGVEFIKNLEDLRFETVSVEKSLNFYIGDFKFTGRLDYLGREDGKYVLVDNKSRDLKPRSKRKNPTKKDAELDSMLKQLYVYAEGVRQKYGELPSKLCFNCFKSGVFIEEPFDMVAYESTMKWVKSRIEEIADTEDFYPRVDYFPCTFICGYSGNCCYYQSSREEKKRR